MSADESVSFRLNARATGEVWKKDSPPVKQLDPGDVVLTRLVLTNPVPQFGKPKGNPVGHSTTTVTRLGVYVRFVSKDTLPGGTLTFKGRTLQGPDNVLRVVGGTGKFANAQGTMTLLNRVKYVLRVYRLQLP